MILFSRDQKNKMSIHPSWVPRIVHKREDNLFFSFLLGHNMNNVTEKKKPKNIASKFHHLLTHTALRPDNLVPLIRSQVLLLNIKLIVV